MTSFRALKLFNIKYLTFSKNLLSIPENNKDINFQVNPLNYTAVWTTAKYGSWMFLQQHLENTENLQKLYFKSTEELQKQ